MNKFIFREIFPLGKDSEEYLSLYKELFKSAYIDYKWLNWYHHIMSNTNGHLSIARTYGVFDCDKLIGIWSVEPKILNYKNNKIKVGRCFAVGISSNYRRLGLFVELSKYAIKGEKDRNELEYILGFPQLGRSVIGGHLKAGWKEVSSLGIMSFDFTDYVPSEDLSTTENIWDFNMFSYRENVDVLCFDSSFDYMNNRYLRHPHHRYICMRNGEGYIVLKNYYSFWHILDLKGNKEEVNSLLKVSNSFLKRHGASEVNIWTHDNYLHINELNEQGFVKGAKNGLSISLIAVKIRSELDFEMDGFVDFGMGLEEGY